MNDLQTMTTDRLQKILEETKQTLAQLEKEMQRRTQLEQHNMIERDIEQHLDAAENSLKSLKGFVSYLLNSR